MNLMTIAAIVKGDFVLIRPLEFAAVVTTQTGSDPVLIHQIAGKSRMGGVAFHAAVLFGDRRVFDSLVQARLDLSVTFEAKCPDG